MTNRLVQRAIGGGEVAGLDELEQSLRMLLRTPLGAVPGRPRYGTTLVDMVDSPPSELAPLVAVEVPRAVRESEPRIIATSARIASVASDGRVSLLVKWVPASNTAIVRESSVAP